MAPSFVPRRDSDDCRQNNRTGERFAQVQRTLASIDKGGVGQHRIVSIVSDLLVRYHVKTAFLNCVIVQDSDDSCMAVTS